MKEIFKLLYMYTYIFSLHLIILIIVMIIISLGEFMWKRKKSGKIKHNKFVKFEKKRMLHFREA